jgi:hypothetical protein
MRSSGKRVEQIFPYPQLRVLLILKIIAKVLKNDSRGVELLLGAVLFPPPPQPHYRVAMSLKLLSCPDFFRSSAKAYERKVKQGTWAV